MTIELDGKTYETIIGADIRENDLYLDSIANTIRVCDQYICFVPWGLKLIEVNNKTE